MGHNVGIKLDAVLYGNFMDGISPKKQKVHEVWVGVIYFFCSF